MIVKLVLCEGPHDTAFISRILRVMGCKNDKTEIGQFPDTLKKFLLSQYHPDVEVYPIHNVRGKMITPNYSLNYKNEILFLLYSMGGDRNKNNRLNIANSFLSLFRTEMSTPDSIGYDLHIVYEFDADYEGTESRTKKVNEEIKELIPDFSGIVEGSYSLAENISWGAYFFTSPGKDTGKLEDIVLPIMRENNEDLFSVLDEITEDRENYLLYQTHKAKMDEDNWNKDKALIGMAGQLHKCGNANASIIEQSCLIDDYQIIRNKSCLDLGSYLLKGSSYSAQ